MAVAAILDLFRWTMGPPTKPHSWCVHPVKISSWSVSSFQVIRIWIFLSFRLESLIHATKISVFLGILTPNLGVHRLDPQKALPSAERRVLSSHWSRSDVQCDLLPWQRQPKKEKKDSGKLAIRPDHPRRRIEVNVCMPGGLRCVVLYFKFY